VDIAVVDKSERGLMTLRLYDDDHQIIECESFAELYTLNFHLQTLAKKRSIEKGLLLIHDRSKNTVNLSIACDENSFFVG
jgi:hypothetical protein